MRPMRIAGVLAAVLLAFSMFGLSGCSCSSDEVSTDTASEDAAITTPETPEEAVTSFFDATTKHGTLTFTSGQGESAEEQRVEYWFDGPRYRLTWFNEDGSIRLHMISPDGVAVYHCHPDEEACELAYTQAEFHQWIFNGPPDWTPGEGVEADGLTEYTYSAKKLWTIEGASQEFYLEDLVVYADDARIIKVITRTMSHQPETADDLTTSTYSFDEPELGVEIPAETFELPYDIVEAE